MSHITFSDLKEKGFKLNQAEAQELHHHVTNLAQRGLAEASEVFAPVVTESKVVPKAAVKETPIDKVNEDGAETAADNGDHADNEAEKPKTEAAAPVKKTPGRKKAA